MNPIDPKRRLPHPRKKPPRLSSVLGDFRLIRKLGGGGATEVYLAEQISLCRRVALKLIRPGSLFFSGAKERLLAEARAAAGIRHPAICPIFETGESGGVPYLVMPYIEGETLAAWIRGRFQPGNPGFRDTVLSILAETARAIHSAHQAGLVHGDIKPSNILITPQDRPVILDFDMAGHEGREPEASSIFPGFRGTPDYMPPERLQPHPAPPTRQGDVYSLGVTLYECLTGQKPFQGPTLERVRENILSGHYPHPRSLDPGIPRDLCLVIATAMEEDPGKRYQSCLEFAGDLERVRKAQPVQARPLSAARKTRRWIRRNPLFTATFFVLLLALILSGVLLEDLREANRRNRVLLRETQALALARASAQVFGKDQILSLLLARAALRKAPLYQTLSQVQRVLASLQERAVFPGGEGPMKDVSFSPSGKKILTRSAGGVARIWTPEGSLLGKIGPKDRFVLKAFFVPPGELVLTVDQKGRVETWTASARKQGSLHPCPAGETRFLASGKGGFLLCWGAGKRAAIISLWGRKQVLLPEPCVSSTFFAASPDGKALVRGDTSGRLLVYDGRGKILEEWKDPKYQVSTISFSADGTRFVTASKNGILKIWSRRGRLLSTLDGGGRRIFSARFSPDGRTLLTAGIDRTVRLWDLTAGKARWILGGRAGLLGARFSPSGKRIMLVYSHSLVEIYDLRPRFLHRLKGHFDLLQDAVFSPDGKHVATASSDGSARLWSLLPGRYPLLDHTLPAGRIGALPPKVECGVFLSTGKLVATGAHDGGLRLWDGRGRLVHAFFTGKIRGVTANRKGDLFLVSCNPAALFLVDRKGRKRKTFAFPNGKGSACPAAFSPDEEEILCSRAGGSTCLWSRTGRRLRVFPRIAGSIPCVDFSPDGKHVLYTVMDRKVLVWEPLGKKVLGFRERGTLVTFARFGPRGERILSATKDGKVKIRDLHGRVLAVLLGHTREVTWAEFSPDGKRIVTASKDATARIWTDQGVPLQVLKGHAAPLTCARFSPSGNRVLTCSFDGTARIWEVRPGEILRLADRICPRDFTPKERREYAHILGGM